MITLRGSHLYRFLIVENGEPEDFKLEEAILATAKEANLSLTTIRDCYGLIKYGGIKIIHLDPDFDTIEIGKEATRIVLDTISSIEEHKRKVWVNTTEDGFLCVSYDPKIVQIEE